jgi:hypothetical protein
VVFFQGKRVVWPRIAKSEMNDICEILQQWTPVTKVTIQKHARKRFTEDQYYRVFSGNLVEEQDVAEELGLAKPPWMEKLSFQQRPIVANRVMKAIKKCLTMAYETLRDEKVTGEHALALFRAHNPKEVRDILASIGLYKEEK